VADDDWGKIHGSPDKLDLKTREAFCRLTVDELKPMDV